MPLMLLAYRTVKRNHGVAGVDKVSIRMFDAYRDENLAPVFGPKFHDHAFGFIKQRNCHQAIEEVLKLHGEEYTVVLDADIAGFSDNLPHCVIMVKVRAEVADGNILDLTERFLAAGVREDGFFKPTSMGTPQGGVLAPPTI